MSTFEKRKIEMDLMNFTRRNFESPSNCRNIDQIRFYINELYLKIKEYETRFDYVPMQAYSLLAQYNREHNRIISVRFSESYS